MVALLSASCSTGAQHVPKHSAYLARQAARVTFVELQMQGNVVTGSIRSATLPAKGSQVRLALGSIHGVAHGKDLQIVVKGESEPKSLVLGAKLSSSALVIVFPKNARGLQKRMTLSPANFVEYQKALDALRLASTKRQGPPVEVASESAALHAYRTDNARVEEDLAKVRREASALNEDVASLVSTTSNETSDLEMVRQMTASAESLAQQPGKVSNNRVCQAANAAAADARNVADDAQFSAGFISGLATTEAVLRRDATGLARDEARVRAEQRSLLNLAPPLGVTAVAVDRALAQASAAKTGAISRTNETIATVNADVQSAFESANQAITAGSCGPPLVLPTPLAPFAP